MDNFWDDIDYKHQGSIDYWYMVIKLYEALEIKPKKGFPIKIFIMKI